LKIASLNNGKRLKLIRLLLVLFIIGLVVSGITAFPLVGELQLLTSWFGPSTAIGSSIPGLPHWLSYVREGLQFTGNKILFLLMAPIGWRLPTW